MDKSAAAQALLSLAQEGKGRTKTARLREILGEIETAQQAGVSNARIVETLNAQGFDLTLKTFETMLYRIRKKQRQTTATPAGLGHDQGKPPATHAIPTLRNADEATPATEPEPPEVGQLSLKQRGERKADQYMKPGIANPLLKKKLKEQP